MSSESSLLAPEVVQEARTKANRILDGLNATLLGQERLTKLAVTACLARGHVLLEGLPGLGKTELVKGLANLLGIGFRRLQFTPDLLPGDVTGGHILEESPGGGRRLVFHEGPIFTNVLLADEINRASPKTQSALLEAMQERRVTVVGETRDLPHPFYVLATQNPIELEGTYPLPEAQLDRFLFKLDVPGVGRDTLQAILTERRGGRPPEHEAVTGEAGLHELFDVVDRIFLPRAVAGWIARLVESTHPATSGASSKVRDYVKHGASPRAAIALAEAARAHALLSGKPNVGFDDVRELAVPTVAHRIVLDYRARLDGVTAAQIVESLAKDLSEAEHGSDSEARAGAAS